MTKKGQKQEQNKGGKKRTKQEASPNSVNDQPEKSHIMADSSPTQTGNQTSAATAYSSLPANPSYGGQYYQPHLQSMTPQQQATRPNAPSQYHSLNQYRVLSPTIPPPWATEIMQDIKFIKISQAKLDKLVDRINARVEKMENESKMKDTKINAMENALQFTNSEMEQSKQKIKDTSSSVKVLSDQCSNISSRLADIKTKTIELETKADD
ncbi:hypothetical protein DPMN_116934 [Dreissena polymorpha]|uniref:Uncharacterized protein n=1 Tax=Dreissena polymorpha TaxID=45954 RepID=A0A9D4KQC5_DREPO|nr:hypothetical protein DPMN_116934 [Dreissena polymorpha]